jgi:hypothetical protein
MLCPVFDDDAHKANSLFHHASFWLKDPKKNPAPAICRERD